MYVIKFFIIRGTAKTLRLAYEVVSYFFNIFRVLHWEEG